jgi:hypothetical protein
MPRILTLLTVVAFAATAEMGSVVVATAQTSAMDKCIAACKQANGKRCERYCERSRANR